MILLSEKPLYNYQLYLALQTLTVILVAGEGGCGEKCVCVCVGGGQGRLIFSTNAATSSLEPATQPESSDSLMIQTIQLSQTPSADCNSQTCLRKDERRFGGERAAMRWREREREREREMSK